MSGEIELFDRGNVLVTDKSFYVRHRTFPLLSISDVEVIYHSRNWMPVAAPLFAALSFEVCALSMHRNALYSGVVLCLLVAAAAVWKGGLRYTVALQTAAGYVRPLTSSDRRMVESLSHILGAAMRRAHQQAAAAPIENPVFRVLAGKAQRAAGLASIEGLEKTLGASAGGPLLVARKPVQPARPSAGAGMNGRGMRRLALAASSL